MRSITRNRRRARQDIDIDFFSYALSNSSIDRFFRKIKCIADIHIEGIGKITLLNHQDYNGKSASISISDTKGTTVESKVDIGSIRDLILNRKSIASKLIVRF